MPKVTSGIVNAALAAGAAGYLIAAKISEEATENAQTKKPKAFRFQTDPLPIFLTPIESRRHRQYLGGWASLTLESNS
jgi:hypothetical protein